MLSSPRSRRWRLRPQQQLSRAVVSDRIAGNPCLVVLEKATGHWCAKFEDGQSAIDAHSGKAWLWKRDGVVHASSFEPPRDNHFTDVRSPDGALRVATSKANAVHGVRLLKEVAGEQRIVLGIVLEPEVVDSQNDIYSADEIARAAHGWMETYQNVGYQHQTLAKGVLPVESYVCPVDCEIGGQPVKAGTWLLALHVVNDDVWKQVKSGELTGLSIGGWAQKVRADQVDGQPIV